LANYKGEINMDFIEFLKNLAQTLTKWFMEAPISNTVIIGLIIFTIFIVVKTYREGYF
jgi:hypothetical protein